MSDQQDLLHDSLKRLFDVMTVPGDGSAEKGLGALRDEIKKRLNDGLSHEPAARVAAFDGAEVDRMQRELASGGPPYWDVLASTDVSTLEAGFKEIGSSYRVPSKHRYSEMNGDELLDRLNDSQRHDAVATLLWKMEQLAQTGNMTKWAKFLDEIARHSLGGIVNADKKLQYLLAFDHIRIEMENWSKEMHRSDDSPREFGARADSVDGSLTNALEIERQYNTGAFLKASVPLASFKLNRGEWDQFSSVLARNACVKTPLTEIARLLAAYLYYSKDRRDAAGATRIANETCWPVLVPIFEARADKAGKTQGVKGQQSVAIEPCELLDFVRMLKHRDVIDFLLSLVAHLYNTVVLLEQRAKLLQPPSSFAQPPPLATKRVHVPKALQIWSQPCYDGSDLNVKFLCSVFGTLIENAILCDPLDVRWLRIAGDYHFARDDFARAMLRYVEVMTAFDKGLIACDMTPADMDEIYSKMSVALSWMEMPTLAVIVGQLRSDTTGHLPHVRQLLDTTPDSVDAGCLYFPLVADKRLTEEMRSAYEASKLPVYHRRLTEEQARLALHERIQEPSEVVAEKWRRVHRLKSLLMHQFFQLDDGRRGG